MSLQEGEVPLECLSSLHFLHVTAREREREREREVPLECLSWLHYFHVTARGISSFKVLVQALLLACHCKRDKFIWSACPGSTTCMSLQEGEVPLECLSRLYYLHVTARGRSSFRVLVQALLLACHCKREKFL